MLKAARSLHAVMHAPQFLAKKASLFTGLDDDQDITLLRELRPLDPHRLDLQAANRYSNSHPLSRFLAIMLQSSACAAALAQALHAL